MKSAFRWSGFLMLVICLMSGCAPEAPPSGDAVTDSVRSPATYDSTLASTLGADQYGMRQYVMAFLKAGPNRDQDSATAAQLQSAHLENIARMARAGDLVLAGPFLDDGELRGIYIFNVATVEEARRLTETDPAVRAGRLEMELHPWYGSAALQQLNDLHSRIATDTP